MSTAGADNFADAPELPFGASSDPTPSAALTVETGEPLPYSSLGRTAWWKVTIPRDCSVNFDLKQTTYPSSIWNADTYLAVYTGTSLGALTRVAANDDEPSGNSYLSEISVNLTAGTTVYVQASSYNSADAVSYVLRACEYQIVPGPWFQPPDNILKHSVTSGPQHPGTLTEHNKTFGARATKSFPADDPDTASANALISGVCSGADDPSYGSSPSYIMPGVEVEYGSTTLEASRGQYVNTYQIADPLPIGSTWNDGQYHYGHEFEGGATSSTLADVTFNNLHHHSGGAATLSGGHGQVVAVANADVIHANFSTYQRGDVVPGAVLFDTAVPAADAETITDEGIVSMMPYMVNRTFGYYTTIDPPTLTSMDQVYGGTGVVNVYVDITWDDMWIHCRPPRCRFIDRVLVSEAPAVTHAPPLRQYPRSDGLGASSARRVWPPPKSIQASNRRVGGYL